MRSIGGTRVEVPFVCLSYVSPHLEEGCPPTSSHTVFFALFAYFVTVLVEGVDATLSSPFATLMLVGASSMKERARKVGQEAL